MGLPRAGRWDQAHFDLFKFTINESTVLCLLIVTSEAEKQLTSVLQIWSLAVTAVRTDSRKYVTRERSEMDREEAMTRRRQPNEVVKRLNQFILCIMRTRTGITSNPRPVSPIRAVHADDPSSSSLLLFV